MTITIDKNVPLPTPLKPGRQKYPFDDMDTGDSFFVPDGKMASLKSAFNGWRYRNNAKDRRFVVRSVTEDGVKGCRVWRSK